MITVRQHLILAALLVVMSSGCSCGGSSRASTHASLGTGGFGAPAGFGHAGPGVGTAGGVGVAGTGVGIGGGAGTDPHICHGIAVNAEPVTPTVVAIIDRSGSMKETLAGMELENLTAESRWIQLRRVLVGTPDLHNPLNQDSLFLRFDSLVRFGAHMYTRSGIQCPNLTWVPPADNNYQALRSTYLDSCTPQNPIHGCSLLPGGGTPTAQALWATTTLLESAGEIGAVTGPDALKHPVLYVLATDGSPNGCRGAGGMPVPQLGQTEEQLVEAEVQRAYGLGVQTYVLSMVVRDPMAEAHLQRVANLGVGLPADAPNQATVWMPKSAGDLGAALTQIVNNAVTCEIKLDKAVRTHDPAVYCAGRVVLNGVDLGCQDPNGWDLVGPSTVRVFGAACDTLLAGNALVDASFPCDVPVNLL